MIAKITINGVIGQDFKSTDLLAFFNKNKQAEEYHITIDSPGGLVDEGYLIAEIIKKQVKPVVTIAKEVMSIATIIFLAANRRIASKKSVFMIHTPIIVINSSEVVTINRHEMTELNTALAEDEKKIIKFYTEATEIDSAILSRLMEKDNYFNGIQAYEMGFATELKDVETYAIFTKNPNITDMNITELFSKFRKAVNQEEEVVEETEKVEEMPERVELSVSELTDKVTALEQHLTDLAEQVARLLENQETKEEIKEETVEPMIEDIKAEILAQATAEAKKFYEGELTKLAAEIQSFAKQTKTNGNKELPKVAVQANSIDSDITPESKSNFLDINKLKTYKF